MVDAGGDFLGGFGGTTIYRHPNKFAFHQNCEANTLGATDCIPYRTKNPKRIEHKK